MLAGTLMPPSRAEVLLPVSPAVLPLACVKPGAKTAMIGFMSNTGPLSLKKTIIVSSKIP